MLFFLAIKFPLVFNLEEKAFYDILKGLTIKYDFTYPEDNLLILAKAVKAVVDDKIKYTDWNQRDDIKAELKVGLILVLAEHGYPPIDRDGCIRRFLNRRRISRSTRKKDDHWHNFR